jgi:F0F1-type ATP synthase membrane subunit c/vacuolar-type H+-ATPase subunit K
VTNYESDGPQFVSEVEKAEHREDRTARASVIAAAIGAFFTLLGFVVALLLPHHQSPQSPANWITIVIGLGTAGVAFGSSILARESYGRSKALRTLLDKFSDVNSEQPEAHNGE